MTATSATDLRLELYRAGFAPIPVAGKKPVFDEWQTKTAVSTEEVKSWSRWPSTGVLTRMTPALDIDILNQAAAEAVEALARNHFAARGHFAVRIGKPPKRAIMFKTTTPFKKMTANLTAPDGSAEKLELLGDGQQIVVDGIHPETGKAYQWHGGSPGSEFQRDDLPNIEEVEAKAFIIAAAEMLRDEFDYQLAASQPNNGEPQDWSALLANIAAGHALHDSLRDLAAKMVVAGMDGGAATNLLRGLLDASAAPEDERKQARRDDIPRAVASAEEKLRPRAASGEKIAKQLLSGKASEEASVEPTPLFPPMPPAAPFPTMALGGVLAKAALAIARKVQVPESIAAQSVLAAAALAAQAMKDVKLPYGQTRPLSLFFATIAASGDRKTSSDNEALWPIRRREQNLQEIYREEHEQWGVAHAAWKAERKKIEGDKTLGFSTRKAQLSTLGPAPLPPLYGFLTAPDPTIEGLVKAWVLAPASLGLFSAEGGQFVGGYGMSADQKLKTAAAFSEMWDARAIKRLRASEPVTILRGRRLAVHMMLQPEAAAVFLSDPVLRDQGLLSRILIAAPETIAGTRLYRDPDPADEAAIRAYGARLLSILEARWPLAEGERNELAPPALALAEDAASEWREFYDRIERRSGPNSELSVIGDFAAKAAEHAARMAGVLTIIADLEATEIDAGAMGCAIVLMDWYLGEMLRLQQAARTDPKLLRAARLLAWLQARGPEILAHDILLYGPATERRKAALDETLTILQAHGWVRELSKRPRRIAVMPPNVAKVAM